VNKCVFEKSGINGLRSSLDLTDNLH